MPAPPPPAPPVPRRESRVMPVAVVEAPPLPTEISLDDDDDLSSPAPRLNLPPLKPPVPFLSPSPEEPLTSPRITPPPQLVREPARPVVAAPEPVPPPPPAATPSQTIPPPAAVQASGDYSPWLVRLLESEGTTAAFFTGNQVEVERNGRREAAAVAAADLASLPDHLRKLAGKGVPRPEPGAPVIDTTLADGTRITALFPPLCDRMRASIRRPSLGRKTLEEMAADGSLSPEMLQVLEACVSTRQNLLIAGDRQACDSLLAPWPGRSSEWRGSWSWPKPSARLPVRPTG